MDTLSQAIPQQRRSSPPPSRRKSVSPPERAVRRLPAQRRRPWVLATVDATSTAVAGLLLGSPAFAVVATVLWLLALGIGGAYAPRLLPERRVATRRILLVGLVLVPAVEVLGMLGGPGVRTRLLGTLAVAVSAGVVARVADLLVLRIQARRGANVRRRLVLVGTSEAAVAAAQELAGDDPGDIEVVAACLVGPGPGPHDVAVHRGFERVTDAVLLHAADGVLVLPCPQLTPDHMRRLSWGLEVTGSELFVSAGLLDVAPGRTRVTTAGAIPVVHVRRAQLHGVVRVLKDLWERMAALVMLVLALPLIAVLVAAIRIESSGPAIFRQVRIGRHGRPFTIFKLRTMSTGAESLVAQLAEVNEADGVLFKVRSDPRVTRLGALLRRYSLDELPQLWNVVRGDMALVGPRPGLPSEVEAYDEDARRRMAVKPGLTGLWQVSGRSDLSWVQTVRLDGRYVDNWSLALDLAIVARTARAVLSHRGAY